MKRECETNDVMDISEREGRAGRATIGIALGRPSGCSQVIQPSHTYSGGEAGVLVRAPLIWTDSTRVYLTGSLLSRVAPVRSLKIAQALVGPPSKRLDGIATSERNSGSPVRARSSVYARGAGRHAIRRDAQALRQKRCR